MRLLIILLVFFNFFNPEYNNFYSRNKEKLLDNGFFGFEEKSKAKLFYKEGFLIIEGLDGKANITIYSIIGNKVAFFPNIGLRKFKEPVSLQRETMYIARIEFSNTVFTYKFFTR